MRSSVTEPSSMNHTMISMHDFHGRRTSLDTLSNFHHGTEHMTEEEKRHDEHQDHFNKDNCFH